MRKFILILWLALLGFPTFAQPGDSTSTQNAIEIADTTQIAKIDTACFKYKFNIKDTLIYRIDVLDSIIADLDEPFFRKRSEEMQVIVDKIDSMHNYHLLISFKTLSIAEWVVGKSQDSTIRTSSPFSEKTILLVIDSLGNRKQIKHLDTRYAVTSAGGNFAPYLFFPLSETCKRKNETFLVKSIDTLAENSFPAAILSQTSLFRVKDIHKSDSLNNVLITFVKTGKGFYAIENSELDLETTSVINSYGELIIDFAKELPVFYTLNQELKLKIKINNDIEKSSWQYTVASFQLIHQGHNLEAIQEEINTMRKQLKK